MTALAVHSAIVPSVMLSPPNAGVGTSTSRDLCFGYLSRNPETFRLAANNAVADIGAMLAVGSWGFWASRKKPQKALTRKSLIMQFGALFSHKPALLKKRTCPNRGRNSSRPKALRAPGWLGVGASATSGSCCCARGHHQSQEHQFESKRE